MKSFTNTKLSHLISACRLFCLDMVRKNRMSRKFSNRFVMNKCIITNYRFLCYKALLLYELNIQSMFVVRMVKSPKILWRKQMATVTGVPYVAKITLLSNFKTLVEMNHHNSNHISN